MNEPTRNQISEQADLNSVKPDSKVKIKNLRHSSQSRAGWAEVFAIMAQNHDDVLLDHFISNEWDQSSWEW